VADVGREADETFADEAALSVVARHALHDEELIAAFATGGTETEADAARAQSFVDRCTACSELHADLIAIQAGVRTDARGTLGAPRDFRLSVNDARRLGGTLSTRGLVERLRRSMGSFGRPVGASLATLGVVGLLVGAVALGSPAGLVPQAEDAGAAAASSAPAATTQIAGGNAPGSQPQGSERADFGPLASTFDALQGEDQGAHREVAGPIASSSGLVFGGSIAALVIGLALLLLALRRPRDRVIPPEVP